MEINREELMVLETSLRNFFLKEKGRFVKNNESYVLMKYRGLSLTMNDDNPRNVLFVVRIAALEAQFQVRDGVKVQGSLAGDERLVSQWLEQGVNKETMIAIATKKKNKKKIENKTAYKALETEHKSIFKTPKGSL